MPGALSPLTPEGAVAAIALAVRILIRARVLLFRGDRVDHVAKTERDAGRFHRGRALGNPAPTERRDEQAGQRDRRCERTTFCHSCLPVGPDLIKVSGRAPFVQQARGRGCRG
jgi:hypothetical protein